MENIFKDAKYGDKFKTRDCRVATFIRVHDDYFNIILIGREYLLFSNKGIFLFDDIDDNKEHDFDIIGKQ